MKKFIIVLFVFMLIFLLSCSNSKNEKVNFREVTKLLYESFEDKEEYISMYVKVGRDNSYYIIDTNPSDTQLNESILAFDYIKKMNELLEFPDYVYEEMVRNNRLNQNCEFKNNKITAVWNYEKKLWIRSYL